jgi:hypothetical protein
VLLVPLESLAGWVQRQQQAELGLEAVEDWRTLETLQVGNFCTSLQGTQVE